MDEGDLVCNYKRCRKRLKDVAYVTSCSHAFCEEHAKNELLRSYTCPACQTNLVVETDIIRCNLQLTEQNKSLMLAGQKPDVISEICFRAISFWVYQSLLEKTYQEHQAIRAKDKAKQMELYYEQALAHTNAELNNLKQQLNATKESLEETKKKYNEVADRLMEKSRQHQKLQSMYDSLRRKCMTMSTSVEPRVPLTPTQLRSGHVGSLGSCHAHLPPYNPAGGDASNHRYEFNPSTGTAASIDAQIPKVRDNFDTGIPTPRR